MQIRAFVQAPRGDISTEYCTAGVKNGPPERIGSILEERIAERNNIDLDALIFEWVPEVIDTVEQQLGIAK